MHIDWQARNSWSSDPGAAFEEAERRIAACVGSHGETLYLGDVKLDRLPPAIASLTWLRDLDLYGSRLADLGPLAPLSSLQTLKAGSLHSPSPNLQFLEGWQELRHLQLIATTPIDLAPLTSCVHLSHLVISCSQHPVELLNLKALMDLRSITHLSLLNMQSDQFETVTGWSGLDFVQLVGSNLTTLAGFDNLLRLKYLSISGCAVTDLSPLANLPRLGSLDVSDTGVHDLSPLVSLASLEDLNIARTPVSDLRPLHQFESRQCVPTDEMLGSSSSPRGLQNINMSGCPVEDLAPLSALERLEGIVLSNTQVTSIEALHGLKALRSLTLNHTRVRDLGSRGSLSRLGYLMANNTPLESLSALEPAPSLAAIDIAHSQVSDLRPLRDARNCRSLILRGSQVNDLTPLAETGSHEEDHRYSPQQLDFRDTPAARRDPRLAEIAAIAETNPGKCFHETKRYLRELSGGDSLGNTGRLWRLLSAIGRH